MVVPYNDNDRNTLFEDNSIDLTLPFSVHSVNMTMIATFCSQTILQKSSIVLGIGPWDAMYSLWER
jgi:hypothetical protein